jgi:transposase
MAGRRVNVLDVREMVRRMRLGESVRRIARDMGVNRETVARYRKIAREEGWLTGSNMPSTEVMDARLAVRDPRPVMGPKPGIEPHRDKVAELRRKGVEVMAIWQLLREKNGYSGSYSSVRRFVRRLEAATPEAFTRVETDIAEEAQVDFGSAGLMYDPEEGRLRKASVFVMTLSWSRHQYTEIVFGQNVETWIALHVRGFEFFGGLPRRVRPDNLKAAIVRAVVRDQEAQRSYREFAEHCGFLISPCEPGKPEHKGKVEKGGVHYVKRNALAGRSFKTPDQNVHHANTHLRRWCIETAGVRVHGTTKEKPLERFEVEKTRLTPLPMVRYEIAMWKKAKLHPDCHIVFEGAYYSAPHRLIGQKLLVRATPQRLEIYHGYVRVATHVRAKHPGQRISNFVHYPPTKLEGLLATPVRLREQAAQVGPKTAELIGKLLEEKPVDRLRAAQGILSLAKRHGPARVEAACRRALIFNIVSYRSVKTILKKNMENEPLPPEAVAEGPLPKTAIFARPLTEIASGL